MSGTAESGMTMERVQPGDAETHSMDVVAGNVEQLKALFPDAFVEGKIDFEVLKQLLGGEIEEREEKYGLSWHGKRRARQIALTPSAGTLRPCPQESVDWDTTQNLMIEGDNLEVLKLLQKSYAGKVKLIYIDPPYNTGKDFVYADDFQDNIRNYLALTGVADSDGTRLSSNTETSGRFHTNWLNMMYPRLRLAKNLMRNDGVILISIDDHEIENARIMCNEIFGEENFIACMIWEKGRKNDAKLISVGHEYLLVFARSQATLRDSGVTWREEKPGARDIWDKYVELRSAHGTDDASVEADLQAWFKSLDKANPAKKWSRYKRVDANGPWRDRDISWPGGGGARYDVLHPATGLPCKVPESGWRYAKSEEMQRQIKIGLVAFREDHTEPPFRKAHIRPISGESDTNGQDGYFGDAEEPEEELAVQVRGSYFYKQSQVAVRQLRELLGEKAFNNPKDHMELSRLFDYVTAGDPEAVILDFFGGSGSSAHAAMEVNVATSGKRRFILVQLPEPLDPAVGDQRVAARYCEALGKPGNIAEITKERIRRAGAQIAGTHPSTEVDLGFRSFKLDASNIRPWNATPENLEQETLDSVDNILASRSEQDVLYELLLHLGLDLCVPIEARVIGGKDVHAIGGGVLFACLPEKITPNNVEAIAHGIIDWHKELDPIGETKVYFRDSAFTSDEAKTNIVAILEQYSEPESQVKMIVRSL
ncbi:site-specific DNA-methyltransferase [Streptomyces sp. NPDC051217]|uniref:site-specific DNA-methyltransferase n=1 Tax=Streptomyces sp. NPDC051217 TaxID=3365644 RepID=UPI0037A37DAB